MRCVIKPLISVREVSSRQKDVFSGGKPVFIIKSYFIGLESRKEVGTYYFINFVVIFYQ